MPVHHHRFAQPWHPLTKAGVLAAACLGLTQPAAALDIEQPGPWVVFQQVDFMFPELPNQSGLNSDWGDLRVSVADLVALTGIPEGYLNVFTNAGWVVQNLPVDSAVDDPVFATFFSLGSNVGPVTEILARVSYSPDLAFAFDFGQPPQPIIWPVTLSRFNARGASDVEPTTIGPPPLPGQLVFDKAAPPPVQHKLGNTKNVQCARNQCVPMAVANSLQFLENEFGLLIPDAHILGLWSDIPAPLVGKLELFMRRFPPSRVTGSGVSMLQMMSGKFKYLKKKSLRGKLIHKHQGVGWGGLGEQLPAGDFTRQGITSKDESVGGKVTWQWICDRIKKHENVEILFEYKKVNGDSNGGHAVRVTGCGKRGGRAWLEYVHDRLQSDQDNPDVAGLETRKVNVDDSHADGILRLAPRRLIQLAVAEGADNDMDGVTQFCDNCPDVFNPGQEDLDGDGVGDHCQFCCMPAVEIVEIRTDQPGANVDEYFELSADPGTLLGELTYLVIGEGSQPNNSGVIEMTLPLTGQVMPADGRFLVVQNIFTLAPLSEADLVISDSAMNFENNDNVTHLLVQNFTGSLGDDLDTDDDGTLDIKPWEYIFDLIALVEQDNPPTMTEFHYGPPEIGPSGGLAPGHVYRCNPDGVWTIGRFDPNDPSGGTDTPGQENPGCDTSIECPEDLDGDGEVGSADLALLLGAWAAGSPAGDIGGLGGCDVPDGVTDFFDLSCLLAAWATGGCV